MDDLENVLIELCLPFLDQKINVLQGNQDEGDRSLEVAELDCVFHYNFVEGKILRGTHSVELSKITDPVANDKNVNLYSLLSKTYETCRRKGLCY